MDERPRERKTGHLENQGYNIKGDRIPQDYGKRRL